MVLFHVTFTQACEFTKLISLKIWVADKFSNFHTVIYTHAITNHNQSFQTVHPIFLFFLFQMEKSSYLHCTWVWIHTWGLMLVEWTHLLPWLVKMYQKSSKVGMLTTLWVVFWWPTLDGSRQVCDKMHRVEISGFFCHSDFTWNQFWCFQKCKFCHFTTFRCSEFVDLGKFHP